MQDVLRKSGNLKANHCMNRIQALTSLGQSLWYDNIQRHLLDNGDLASMIMEGEIKGVTSNPSIFHNAIVRSNDYDTAIMPMALAGWDGEKIFWQLASEDIRRTCDLFLPVYLETKGVDGYVSLEVHPKLAGDRDGTLAQAIQIWEQIKRPNLMIKIPATTAGIQAIKSAIAAGINVNVTLIFSLKRYQEVIEAYLAGLEDWFSIGKKVDPGRGVPISVASFFISRIDTKVDALLPPDSQFLGKIAIACARLAYGKFRKMFSGPRWEELEKKGAYLQRPLWASTSTKNPAYPDTLYIDGLIGLDTINTVPPQTLRAFKDHGNPSSTLSEATSDSNKIIKEIENQGISMDQITRDLEEEGVEAFSSAFSQLIEAINEKRHSIVNSLGPLAMQVQERILNLEKKEFAKRLWNQDPSLWSFIPRDEADIQKRLGWLTLPEKSRTNLEIIQRVSDEIHQAGIQKVLLLGMGGSSLASEVLSQALTNMGSDPDGSKGSKQKSIELAVLDSIDPNQVNEAIAEFPPSKSIYIISSKSGDTIEVNTLLDYFWEIADRKGSQFIAITDPGTVLESIAIARGFRATLLADPTVGGRYSVFSVFGLLSMALLGINLTKVLDSATGMMRECQAEVPAGRNPGLVTGALLGEAALAGRDKVTLVSDEQAAPFGSWLEQLITESSGKEGKGIIVIDEEPIGEPSSYGNDRLFIHLKVDKQQNKIVETLKNTGHPIVEFFIKDIYSLMREFYRWEMATAVACHILEVNPFNQPDVQDTKERTKRKLAIYQSKQEIKLPEPLIEEEGIKVFTSQDIPGSDLHTVLRSFLSLARRNDYIAINAYLPRNPLFKDVLNTFRRKIKEITKCATTLGFGPRFLHSTGQLQKGGPNSCLFIQLTYESQLNLTIPSRENSNNSKISLGQLGLIQAMGDFEALEARGRRIVWLHLPLLETINRIGDFL